jgi:uncharacterized FAD-dependent dehydrogenase
MIKEIQLRLRPEEAASEQGLKRAALRATGEKAEDICAVRVLKRSIDARQRDIYVNLSLRLFLREEPEALEYRVTEYHDVSEAKAAIVVGAGPGGLFAALRLIELGRRPILLERGKDVHERRRDIAAISRSQTVDPESNYCFGEGGAGAFSDGKLFTRSKKRGPVDDILHLLCQFGASPGILSDAHPHIGTDKLPRIIEGIRQEILRCGGEVHFGTRVDGLLLQGQRVEGVSTSTGEEFLGPVILATGHSARDVYYYLHGKGLRLEAKGSAMGVRLEHPQALIDQIRYHRKEGRGAYLPPAEYNFVTQVDGRGVYSFCMCPGGFVVPAASGPEQVVVNGMSPSSRAGRWANSGMVVEIHPEDLPPAYAPYGELALLKFQEDLEHKAFEEGGYQQTAPAQRMEDFTRGRLSASLPASSYTPGLCSSALNQWLPETIAKRLREGLLHFGRSARGFLTNEAQLIGVETRTSSPLRIPRDKESLQYVELEGLYPCGEGAGYAGGIVSAALDGQSCAEALVQAVRH